MSLRTSLRSYKSRIHSLVGQLPFFYRFAATVHPVVRRRFVQSDTVLVIDGYPRSANTFAYHAFRWAQESHRTGEKDERMHVAHHLHQPAQILCGVQRGVPTVTLIRRPKDCILSYVIRHPDWLGIEAALKKYISFYASILDVKDRVILGDFGVVTNNFGRVIQQVNNRFGTNFCVFEHSAENEKAVFQRIEQVNRQLHGGDERGIARPSSYREQIKEKRREELAQHKTLLQEAQALYRDFVM